MASSETSSSVPGWVTGLAGASALGVALTENPVAFVQAVVVEWIVGGLLSLGGEAGALLSEMWGITASVFVMAGAEVARPFGIAGDAVLEVLGIVSSIVYDVAAMGGPLAPLIVVLAWGVVVVALAYLARTLLEVIKWVT